MEKVRPWCGQPSDGSRTAEEQNRTAAHCGLFAGTTVVGQSLLEALSSPANRLPASVQTLTAGHLPTA